MSLQKPSRNATSAHPPENEEEKRERRRALSLARPVPVPPLSAPGAPAATQHAKRENKPAPLAHSLDPLGTPYARPLPSRHPPQEQGRAAVPPRPAFLRLAAVVAPRQPCPVGTVFGRSRGPLGACGAAPPSPPRAGVRGRAGARLLRGGLARRARPQPGAPRVRQPSLTARLGLLVLARGGADPLLCSGRCSQRGVRGVRPRQSPGPNCPAAGRRTAVLRRLNSAAPRRGLARCRGA